MIPSIRQVNGTGTVVREAIDRIGGDRTEIGDAVDHRGGTGRNGVMVIAIVDVAMPIPPYIMGVAGVMVGVVAHIGARGRLNGPAPRFLWTPPRFPWTLPRLTSIPPRLMDSMPPRRV